ncbi:MAG: hypothetical protein KC501_18040 [Myxococcales bacterium]|nr:hypothetical protein [Myxococcales bacterium]
MRPRDLLPLLVPLALAVHGCNETTPTTPPDEGSAAPSMPDAEPPADEMFDDEPEPEDPRDVDDAG